MRLVSDRWRVQHPAMAAITISTFRELLQHQYELACWCPGCRRWATCDLGTLVREGLGDRAIQACRPRCRKCGERGQWQVRPPVPAAPRTLQ